MTDTDIRSAILSALEEYTFRLQTIFVSRTEFDTLETETRRHEAAIAALQGALEHLTSEVTNIARVIERATWAIVLAMSGAIFAAMGSLIFR